jgi:hypothetical protein
MSKMKVLLLLLLGSVAYAADNLEIFGIKWAVPLIADWAVEKQEDIPVLRMLVARPQTAPRRPVQFALAETPDFQRVTLQADVKRLGGSLILVYAYRDPAHFNYAHLSVDEGTKQPVHNGIFHVYGGERVRISREQGPASLPSMDDWYKVQLTYDAATGIAAVNVNGKPNQALEGVDLSLGPGRVGIGSFFETALFRNVKILGTPAAKK